jgi:hypothetical protein
MRANEFDLPLKTFMVKLRLKQSGHVQQFNTTIQARNSQQARQLLRAQYNNPNVLVGQPREIKPR